MYSHTDWHHLNLHLQGCWDISGPDTLIEIHFIFVTIVFIEVKISRAAKSLQEAFAS